MTDRIEGARPRLFRPYPAYKDSGVEWLGNIPAHWNIAPVYARYEVALGKMLDARSELLVNHLAATCAT